MLKMKCCSPPAAPISIPSVLSYHHRSSRPPHLSEGPPHSLSNTMARRRGNCLLPVFVGSAGRQLHSAPPLPPPRSHSTKAGISLTLHPLHSVALFCIKAPITHANGAAFRRGCPWLNLSKGAPPPSQPRERCCKSTDLNAAHCPSMLANHTYDSKSFQCVYVCILST